jgi:hypothetical protein
MHAYEIPGLRFSLPAGGTVLRRRFVNVNSSSAGVYATAGGAAIGVSMNEVLTGEVLEIADGIVMVDAGAAITAGASIEVGTSGQAITKNTGVGVGVAITGASGIGEVIAVKLANLSAIGTNGEDGLSMQTIVYTATDLAAAADLADITIGIVPAGYTAEVIAAQVISNGAAEGIDADNTSVFNLEVGSASFAGFTFDATNAFPAAGAAQVLTLVPAEVDLSAGDVLLLSVTNGTTANLPVFIVQVTLALTPVE